MFTPYDAISAARALGLPFSGFSPDDLAEGMNVELEHGSKDPRTDVTHDDALLSAKIAVAHLYERPDYYVLLRELEDAPRQNPAATPTRLRIETIDSTRPGYAHPHVDVWMIEEPATTPTTRQSRKRALGQQARSARGNLTAEGWSMYVYTVSPRGSTYVHVPHTDRPGTWLRAETPTAISVRWTRMTWRWTGRWGNPESVRGVPEANFTAPWSDPTRLEGDLHLLDLPEYTLLQQEYLRVLPLLIEAFR
jgi:hypothetical protein